MKITELMTTAQDMISVRRVFAEPIERDGVTVIPAALIVGGGGGGGGADHQGQEGEGGGFGVGSWPVGAYVVREGKVRWVPAVDLNRILAVLGGLIIAYLFSRTRIARVQAATKGRGE